jgi:hypothetical protein
MEDDMKYMTVQHLEDLALAAASAAYRAGQLSTAPDGLYTAADKQAVVEADHEAFRALSAALWALSDEAEGRDAA